MKGHILIVDDEKGMREFLRIALKREGYRVSTASTAFEGLSLLEKDLFDMVVSDLKMPSMNGIEFLKRIKRLNPDIVVIMITAYASVDTAVEAMKEGAYDYVSKPLNLDELFHIMRNALDSKRIERENILLKRELKGHFGFGEIEGIGEIVGQSPRMKGLYEIILKVAKTNTNCLIMGESGTGKELIARAIHRESARGDGPFVPINCGAIPENLIESELFGYERGAFTGAVAQKKGLLEIADKGTLFLDEVTELAPNIQVKLLRVIQERRFKRLGGTQDIDVDIRLISATNKEIEREVKEGRLREDLYFRMNVIPILIPPLRERKEDIPLLVNYFIKRYTQRNGKDIKGIDPRALELLMQYTFPGNVRELENMVERAVTLEPNDTITCEILFPNLTQDLSIQSMVLSLHSQVSKGVDFQKVIAGVEKRLLFEALKKAGGVKKKAAQFLNISFRSLRYLMDKHGIG